MTHKRYVATNLDRVLTEQGRLRSWLAAEVGVSRSLITLIAKGHRTVSRDLGERIATAIGVPFFVLFDVRESSESERSIAGAA